MRACTSCHVMMSRSNSLERHVKVEWLSFIRYLSLLEEWRGMD